MSATGLLRVRHRNLDQRLRWILGAQEASKTPQDASKIRQDGAKMGQDASKRA